MDKIELKLEENFEEVEQKIKRLQLSLILSEKNDE